MRLANTSSRLGHLLDCPTLIGGHIEQLDDRTIFTTQLLCTNTAAPSEIKVVEMKMSKGKLSGKWVYIGKTDMVYVDIFLKKNLDTGHW